MTYDFTTPHPASEELKRFVSSSPRGPMTAAEFQARFHRIELRQSKELLEEVTALVPKLNERCISAQMAFVADPTEINFNVLTQANALFRETDALYEAVKARFKKLTDG